MSNGFQVLRIFVCIGWLCFLEILHLLLPLRTLLPTKFALLRTRTHFWSRACPIWREFIVTKAVKSSRTTSPKLHIAVASLTKTLWGSIASTIFIVTLTISGENEFVKPCQIRLQFLRHCWTAKGRHSVGGRKCQNFDALIVQAPQEIVFELLHPSLMKFARPCQFLLDHVDLILHFFVELCHILRVNCEFFCCELAVRDVLVFGNHLLQVLSDLFDAVAHTSLLSLGSCLRIFFFRLQLLILNRVILRIGNVFWYPDEARVVNITNIFPFIRVGRLARLISVLHDLYQLVRRNLATFSSQLSHLEQAFRIQFHCGETPVSTSDNQCLLFRISTD
mmetsp:Transcript_16680/g.26510  ORF Transcript_16680/g.26510 Transcript_16680/m.26510 type:complete len:335 (+) Transcript_16680:413-1417(+)